MDKAKLIELIGENEANFLLANKPVVVLNVAKIIHAGYIRTNKVTCDLRLSIIAACIKSITNALFSASAEKTTNAKMSIADKLLSGCNLTKEDYDKLVKYLFTNANLFTIGQSFVPKL